MDVSPAEHVAMVQSLFLLDDTVRVDQFPAELKKDRKALARKVLELLLRSDEAKAKGLATVEALKEKLSSTKKHADVLAVQGMLCNIYELPPPPPAMLGVFWCGAI